MGSSAAAGDLSLSSPAFKSGGTMPMRFSCDAAGVSPPLKFAHVPGKTKSLALTVQDPDAPAGIWTHWVVYDLPPSLKSLPKNVAKRDLPKGAVTVRNSYNHTAYGAVCPPSGTHHYVFTLYALDKQLPQSLADVKALQAAIKGHVIAQTQLTGTYTRR